jgi:hypothetical protein
VKSNGTYTSSEVGAKLAEIAAGLALLQEAVGKLRRPPITATRGIDPALAAGPLAKVLWQVCGRHKALVLRTRLTQLAEAEDGRRQPHSGRDLVARGGKANGHTKPAIIVDHPAELDHVVGHAD